MSAGRTGVNESIRVTDRPIGDAIRVRCAASTVGSADEGVRFCRIETGDREIEVPTRGIVVTHVARQIDETTKNFPSIRVRIKIRSVAGSIDRIPLGEGLGECDHHASVFTSVNIEQSATVADTIKTATKPEVGGVLTDALRISDDAVIECPPSEATRSGLLANDKCATRITFIRVSSGHATRFLPHSMGGANHNLAIVTCTDSSPARHVTHHVLTSAEFDRAVVHLVRSGCTRIHSAVRTNDAPVRDAIHIGVAAAAIRRPFKTVGAFWIKTRDVEIDVPSWPIVVTHVAGEIDDIPKSRSGIRALRHPTGITSPVHGIPCRESFHECDLNPGALA